ncbi:MAG: CDGSH iron-sulfur domain-containing protein [bacterium]
MSDTHKPIIYFSPNGPIILIDRPETQAVEHLRGPHGEQYQRPFGVSLCRCGNSTTKPFCDGTHGRIGWKSENAEGGHADVAQSFAGPEGLTVHYNRSLCAGAAVCVKTLPKAFVEDAADWIRPNEATADALKKMLPACPSGALSYSINGERMPEPHHPHPQVKVEPNGPYRVVGSVELPGVAFHEGASREHFTLCRCGRSKSKPFCDYSHAESGWTDGSAVAE